MRRLVLLALFVSLGCSESEPAPPPPRLGGEDGRPSVGVGSGDGSVDTDGGVATTDGGGGAGLCVEVDGGASDPNRLFLSYGELALDYTLGTVVADWITPVSCDATRQLRVTLALPEAACDAAGTDRLNFVFDDPGDLPNATSSTVTLADDAPSIVVRYSDSGDAARDAGLYGNCTGSSGTITFDAMDSEAGLKAAVFDLDLTRCDDLGTAVLSATGAFEIFVPTAFDDVCTP